MKLKMLALFYMANQFRIKELPKLLTLIFSRTTHRNLIKFDSSLYSSLSSSTRNNRKYRVKSRTFKIERITIFILSFYLGLVTQLNDPALGVLKHHYITKRICEFLIGNLRFLIYNLLNQLL